MITQGHSKKLASTEKNKNMLKLINSACDICDNDIAHFPLPVTKIARKTTFCALRTWNYIFKPSRRVPWNLFLFVRMNTFVYYHSALLAHFPPEDTKIAEELRGAPRESPHNRDFEETVNLIVRDDMVDRHPSKSIVNLGSASVDNVSSGWQSTMSSRKECNIYIIALSQSYRKKSCIELNSLLVVHVALSTEWSSLWWMIQPLVLMTRSWIIQSSCSLPENPVVRRPRPVKSVADLWKVDNEKSCGLVIFELLKKTF